MPRYVDAEKIEKTLWDSLRGYRHVKEKCAVKNCILEIEEAPTADVVEVKHGEWRLETDEEMPNPMFKLVVYSACNNKASGTYSYCPHCGAKMDGSLKLR